jgi:hypothetical protein
MSVRHRAVNASPATAGFAWITCSLPDSFQVQFDGDGVSAPPISSTPNCRRPGPNIDTVHYIAPNKLYAHQLDKGRWLDPRSLRRNGRIISWTRAGERHRYRIPPEG